VSRPGGDAFVILLPEIDRVNDAAHGEHHKFLNVEMDARSN
jgi:hypothetical protein